MGIENSKSIDSLLLSVLIFVTNLFDKCIVFFAAPILFFLDKFIGLKSNVTLIFNKSLPKDFYAMVLSFIEFATTVIFDTLTNLD